MSEDWVRSTLGDLCEVQGGGTPSTKSPEFWGGNIVWLTPTEVVKADGTRIRASERSITPLGLDNSSAKLLPRGTVLLTTRASVGFAAIADVALTTNQGFQSLIPRGPVSSEYLMLWVQANRHEFTRRAGGSTFPEISKRNVASIPIDVPPIPVQRRIVDLMRHLDDHVENLRSERAASEGARMAAMERWIEEAAGERSRLGDVLSIARGGSPRPIDDYFTDDPTGLNWIKIGDVAPGERYITSTAQRIRREGLSKTRRVSVGDFLLSNSMSFGRPYILKIDGCIHDGWLVLSGVNRSFNVDFLYYLLRSRGVQDQFSSLAAGSGVKNLNVKSVESVVVRVPHMDVQQEIAARLSAWSHSIESLSSEEDALTLLRGRILDNLLSGDLTINKTYDSLLEQVS